MAVYERGDIVTYYFVIYNDGTDRKIVAWTDDKDLLKFYLEFHKCKDFVVKKYTKRAEEFNEVIDENRLDEIKIVNIKVRDPENRHKWKFMQIPATESDAACIRDNTSDCMGSDINYSDIHKMIYYLKNKWFRALEDIYLPDAISRAVYSKNNTMMDHMEFDELIILFKTFPDQFGI